LCKNKATVMHNVPFLNWNQRYAIQKCDKVFTSYFVVLELDNICN
jgi:hypothetical protein